MPRYGYLVPTRGAVLASDDDETVAARTAAEVLGLARRAERLGFRSAWVGDSPLAKPRHDSLATLAAIGAQTDAIDLGTAVAIPALRHPVSFAHQAASVDQLTGGRLRLGVGVSGGADGAAEFRAHGVPFERRGPRLTEHLEVCRRLWAGEVVDHDGEHYTLEDVQLGFGPVGDLPVYVATNTFDPEEGPPGPILDRIVSHAGGWLPIGLDPETYDAGLDHVRSALDEVGRDPDALDPAMYLDVVIDEDEAAALDEARRFLDRYYPDWDPFTDEEVRARGAFGPEAVVAERLEAFAEAGAETLVVRFISTDQRAQLRRFAELL